MAQTVKLESVYEDGSAFLGLGDQTYVRDAAGETRQGSLDDLYAGDGEFKPNGLAEWGREFPTLEDATAYLTAVTSFDRMMRYSIDSERNGRNEDLRTAAIREQEAARSHREVLATIPGFEKLSPYLEMQPDQIVRNMELRAYFARLVAFCETDPFLTIAERLGIRRSGVTE